MFFCAEDRNGYHIVWLPAKSIASARRFAEWIGLGLYISPVQPFLLYQEALDFIEGIPMWAVGR